MAEPVKRGWSIHVMASPPAYHLPAWGWPILRQHESMCDDCTYVTVEAHDCPACVCEESWWDHCDVYQRLYDQSVVPTLDEQGRHLTEDEVTRRMVEDMNRRLAAGLGRRFTSA